MQKINPTKYRYNMPITKNQRKYKYDEYSREICFVCTNRPADIIHNEEMYCATCYIKNGLGVIIKCQ
jgi:hypothetical protein